MLCKLLAHVVVVWLASIVEVATAWTSSGLSVDLAWPSVGHEGYFTTNGGQIVTSDPSPFPCASFSPPADVARVEFPLTGAQLQFDLRNATTPGQFFGYEFIANTYLGQFSSDVTADKSGWTYVTTSVFTNSSTGPQCLDALNITNEVLVGPSMSLELASQSLVGLELTLGVRTVLFDADNNNYEEMFQCSYLRLVPDDAPVTQNRGVCNAGPGTVTSIAASPTGTPTSEPTTNVGTNNVTSGSNGSGHSGRTIGIAVGVSVGVAALLVGLGCFVLRRRKKNKGTIALGFWTAGKEDDSVELGEKKDKKIALGNETSKNASWNEKKGKEDKTALERKDNDGISIESSSAGTGSIHSEPLPEYQQKE